MLTTPLQPFIFPPPSSSSPLPLPLPTISKTAPSDRPTKQHRHTKRIKNALELLVKLADQAVTPAEREEGEDVEREEGIIGNLATHGWQHQTTNNGIRIFQLDTDSDAFVPTPNDPTLRTSALERTRTTASTRTVVTSPGMGGVSSRRGLRADEVLPFFRGEGWIEGSWKKEDVAATIGSSGARAIWDPRYDSTRSQTVELLSDTDALLHMHIRGSFVADRDACMVTTHAGDEREGKEGVLYVAACSVEDPLVPSGGTRTTVHLNGFAIRSLPKPPHFEPPPPMQSDKAESVLADLPPTRPSHRRTKSSMSVINNTGNTFLSPHPPLPSSSPFNSLSVPLHAPPPPPLHQTLSSSTIATSSNGPSSASDSAFPFPLTFQSQNQANEGLRISAPPAPSTRPGLALSMLIRASPGYNLPHSMLQQLSVHLPLSIASIGRFLSSHGFAPYLIRDRSRARLREEEFDAQAGRYRIVFSVDEKKDGEEEEVKIRFYGGTFGGGRYDVEVQHVRPEGWRIEQDVPSTSLDEALREQKQEELGGEGSGRWKSSVSIHTQKLSETRQRSRWEESPSIGSPGGDTILDEPLHSDPALVPGPLGGCTLVIDPSATTLHLPVIVTISRPCVDLASQPLAKVMRSRSKALAKAAQVALDDNSIMCDSLEEFLECGREGDERAEMCLKGARMILRELDRAQQEEETRTSSRLQLSSLFGDASWKSPRSPASNRPLASPRRLGRPPSSLSLRFANS